MVIRKNLVILLGLVMTFMVGATLAQPRLAEIQREIPRGRSHPFLHFNRQDLEAIRARTKSDRRTKLAYQTLLAEANRIMDLEVSKTVPPRFKGISPYFDGQDEFGLYRDELSVAWSSAWYTGARNIPHLGISQAAPPGLCSERRLELPI
jgi:hypothetical protein